MTILLCVSMKLLGKNAFNSYSLFLIGTVVVFWKFKRDFFNDRISYL